MRFALPLTAICAVVAIATAGFDSRPGTAPSTQPALFAVHGKVSIGAGIDQPQIDLSHVVVYLDSDPVLDAAPLPDDHLAIAQKNKEFVPKFLAVPRNTPIEFPNWDHISHNVFSRSAAAPAFDLDRYPYGVSKTRTFTKVGTVQLFCNIHPHMRAMVYVTPNPYFSRVDKDGQFKIDHIPAGHYVLVAWHDRCVTVRQAIDIGSNNSDPSIAFSLVEDRGNIMANNPPSHGDAYGTERGLGIKHEQLNLPVVTESHAATTPEPCPNCK
jgi:plastocyanin